MEGLVSRLEALQSCLKAEQRAMEGEHAVNCRERMKNVGESLADEALTDDEVCQLGLDGVRACAGSPSVRRDEGL